MSKCMYCGNEMNPDSACPGCGNLQIVVEHDSLPVGILCLSNVTRAQWDDVMQEYRRRVDSGSKDWKGSIVVFGLDPRYITMATYTKIPRLDE